MTMLKQIAAQNTCNHQEGWGRKGNYDLFKGINGNLGCSLHFSLFLRANNLKYSGSGLVGRGSKGDCDKLGREA